MFTRFPYPIQIAGVAKGGVTHLTTQEHKNLVATTCRKTDRTIQRKKSLMDMTNKQETKKHLEDYTSSPHNSNMNSSTAVRHSGGNLDDDDDDDDDDVVGTGFLDEVGGVGGGDELALDADQQSLPPLSIANHQPHLTPSQQLALTNTVSTGTESHATVRAGNTKTKGSSGTGNVHHYDSFSDLFESPSRDGSSSNHGSGNNGTKDVATAAATTMPALRTGPISPPRYLPKPKAIQDRKVSWGNNVTAVGSMDSNNNQNILLPSIGGGGGGGQKDAASLSPPQSTAWDWSDYRDISPNPSRAYQGDASIMDLRQLVKEASPFETEAETLLIQELEDRISPRSRANTGTSTLLSSVPDDNVHNFTLSKPSPSVSPQNSPKPTHYHQQPPGGRRDYADSKTISEPSSNNLPDPPQFASTSTDDPPSIMTTENRPPATRPPLSGGTATAKLRRAVLKRDRTVEGTLHGLETAMRAIHDEHHQNDDGVSPDDYGIPSSSNQPNSTTTSAIAAAGGSADYLAHNANILFSRPVPKKMVSERPNSGTSAGSSTNKDNTASLSSSVESNLKKTPSRWALFADSSNHSKTSLEVKKKTDDDDDKADLEVGGQQPSQQTPLSLSGTSQKNNNSIQTPELLSGSKTKKKDSSMDAVTQQDYQFFNDFLKPRKATIVFYCKSVILYLMIPATSVAAILFYLASNPPTGKAGPNGQVKGSQSVASASWWILFMCVRQVITFSAAKALEAFVIDFLCLRTRWPLRIFGPVLTLFIVQSKGWPCTVFFWSLLDFGFLQGPHPFTSHWLFWQPYVGLFNQANPAGNIVDSVWNKRILAVALSMGIVAAVKRLAMGLYLGRQTFANYGEELAKLMSKMVLVSQVATLSRQIEKTQSRGAKEPMTVSRPAHSWSLRSLIDDDSLTDEPPPPPPPQQVKISTTRIVAEPISSGIPSEVIESENREQFVANLGDSTRIEIAQLLDEWEEPERKLENPREISISAVLQFRRALDFMDVDYPFSIAFGLADTRESCIVSSQDVYRRLLSQTPGQEVLHFDTIALVAMERNSVLDKEKLKELVRLFRPERDGNLSMLDFVKSVDSVYKSMRLLRATIENSSQIDRAFENIFNIFFYITIGCIILAQLGYNPHTIYLSFSSFILAFAFMIGSASAKYFDGLLLILVQRPYGIGDRIHVASAQSESNASGAQGWIVENVTLFKTTVRLGATNERATIANGALAGSRIINGARSPKALMYVTLKFGLDIPYEKIQIFRSVVERFVKARPREWVAMSGFRSKQVAADLGYIEYTITVQHRESWQNIGQLLQSQSDLSCFCLEVSKKMAMRYVSPALPVNLSLTKTASLPDTDTTTADSDKPTHQHMESLGSSAFKDISELFEKRD